MTQKLHIAYSYIIHFFIEKITIKEQLQRTITEPLRSFHLKILINLSYFSVKQITVMFFQLLYLTDTGGNMTKRGNFLKGERRKNDTKVNKKNNFNLFLWKDGTAFYF